MALITAVLITALVTMAAVAMASQQVLETRRTANVIDGDRAYVFALGVESWVRQILLRDARDNHTDNLGEDWATTLPPISVEGATLTGHVEDMQGRFNLNDLLADGRPSVPDLERFRRLLTVLGLNPDLANAVLDWMDSDSQVTFPGGAEDGEYMRADPPYRAANRPLANASELRLVQGVTADVYDQLKPYVVALPARTPINVNTAPGPVLMSLADGITESDAKALVEARGKNGFATVQDFLAQDALAGRKISADGLSVASSYFLLDSAVAFGRGRTRLFSLLARSGPAVQVLARAQGVY